MKIHHSKVIISLVFLAVALVASVGTAEPANAISLNDIVSFFTAQSNVNGEINVDHETPLKEGKQTYHNVTLSAAPNDKVTVSISSNNAGVAVHPNQRYFGETNYTDPQPFLITVYQDSDNEDDSVSITYTATGGGYDNVEKSLDLTIKDDEPSDPQIEVSLASSGNTDCGGSIADGLVLAENKNCVYEVKLNQEPSMSINKGVVTVTMSSDNSDVTLNTTGITFNPRNYNESKTVKLTAKHDTDGIKDVAVITHTSTGGGYRHAPSKTFNVAVTDDETTTPDLGVVVTPSGLTINENTKKSYNVKLSHRPGTHDDVTVTIAETSDLLTLTPSTLTFNTSNWNTDQTVNLTAGSDDQINPDIMVNITHTADKGYGQYGSSGAEGNLTVTIKDTDTAGLKVPSRVDVNEGSNQEYTVGLESKPKENVTVSIVPANGNVTVDPATLTFTNADWADKTVTVTGVQDADSNNEYVVITHTATSQDSNYNGLTELMTAAVDDDELVNPTIVLNVASVSVDEGGTVIYKVKLNQVPTEAVTVNLASNETAKATVLPASMTFTTSNWNIYQNATVTGVVETEDDGSDEKIKITHTGVGGGFGTATADLAVTVRDPDPEFPEILTPSTLIVDEGDQKTYTVKLNEMPTRTDVGITLTSSNENVTVSPASLTFTAQNWNVLQVVNISAAEDDNDSSNEMVSITHSASGGGYSSVTKVMKVVVNDNEPTDASIVLSPSSLSMEEGETTTYTLKLDDKPSANVTVTLTYKKSLIRVDSASFTFTRENYNQARTVQITAKQDLDNRNNQETVTHTANGGGYVNVQAALRMEIDDDEPSNPEITIAPATVTVTEGSTGTYAVTLNERPNAEVTVSSNISNSGVTLSPSTLTFTRENWNQAQTVQVTAEHDDDNLNNQTTITHEAASGGYTGARKSINVTVEDDEPGNPGMTVAPSAITINELSTSTYTVTLNETPGSDVAVSISYDSNVLLVSPSSLVFTTQDWSRPKTVSVTAKHDQDNSNNQTTVTHTATGGGYNGIQGSVSVSVNDHELVSPAVVLSATRVNVTENSTAAYAVRLSEMPKISDVSVRISSNRASVITMQPSVLTFTSSNWNVNQTVTISALHDNDAVNDVASLTHTANGGGYHNVQAPALTVNIKDNISAPAQQAPAPASNPEIITSRNSMSIDEGDEEDYEVKLSKQPTGTVTVRIRSSKSDVDVDPETLVFTTSNWNDYQDVEVSVSHDSDSRDEEGVITHTATGGGYDSVPEKEVDVDIDDDDTEENGGSSRTAQTAAPQVQLPVFRSSQTLIDSKASAPWSSWQGGQTYTANLGSRNVVLKDITFTPIRTTYEPVTYLAKLNSRPPEISQDPAGDQVYSFFEIATNGAVRYNTNTAKITVEVENLWLDANNLSWSTVKLWTFNEKTKKWQGVPVTRSNTSVGTSIVSHISLANSLFSVTADKMPEPETEKEEEPEKTEPVEETAPPVVEQTLEPEEEEEKKKIKITSLHAILFVAGVLALLLGVMIIAKAF